MQITKELVLSIDELLSHGLSSGLGVPEKGKMCVEAAICFALGEPHNDKPSCVGSEVRLCKIALNDCNWSSNEARAKGMRDLSIAQLGSIELNQVEFKKRLFYNSCKTILIFLIKRYYEEVKNEELIAWIKKFKECDELNVDKLWKEFYNYYYSNYNYYNNYYSNYNYYYSNYNNYYNYYNNYYYYYNYYNNGDEFLLVVAGAILQTLKDLNCKGVKFI